MLIQLLVDDQVRQLFLEVIIASRPAFENSVLKTAFEKQLVRAEITISDFIRTIVGQLLAYFFQNKLLYDLQTMLTKKPIWKANTQKTPTASRRFADGDKEWSGKPLVCLAC